MQLLKFEETIQNKIHKKKFVDSKIYYIGGTKEVLLQIMYTVANAVMQ